MNRDRVQELLLAERVLELAVTMMRTDARRQSAGAAFVGAQTYEEYVPRALKHLEDIAAMIIPPGTPRAADDGSSDAPA